jgi:hypothetical protein
MGLTIQTIENAVKSGTLKEPFKAVDVHAACPKIPLSTCRTFLPKHRKGNPSKTTELFIKTYKGYTLI